MTRMPTDDIVFPGYVKTPLQRKVFSETEYVWHMMVWRHFPSGLTNWQRSALVKEVCSAMTTAARIAEHDDSPAARSVHDHADMARYERPVDRADPQGPCEGVNEEMDRIYGPPPLGSKGPAFQRDGYTPTGGKMMKPHPWQGDHRPLERQEVSREFRGKVIAENLAAQIALNPGKHAWPKAMQAALDAKPDAPNSPADMVNLPPHYAAYDIEPIRFIVENKIGWCEGNIIKYTMRWKHKNGWQDLEKVLSYANLLMAYEDGDPEWWTINRRKPLLVPQYLKQGRASGNV